ncbi:MAG: hypothetical protein KQ78_00699 [Candidatus Izimaplasma bacterium HR2]|nr:MAG: hypothetical protein KQ78_00699 [Candidatus Izimaplasma bacterium HR2]
MMKKILLFLMIPLTLVGFVAAVKAVSADDIDYEILYGNSLSGVEFDSNSYIETLEKEEVIYDMVIPDSFTFVAADSDIELYVEEESLAIAVRVKANGYVYSSYNFDDPFIGDSESITNPIKSGVSIGLYKESTPVSQSYLDVRTVYTDDGVEVGEERVATSTIRTNSTGFIANIDFTHPELMIKFDLHVNIVDGNIVINVPRESIIEYNPNIWQSDKQYYILRNIVLFPYFGSTTSESDGYVVIPDGSGALISLESDPAIKASFDLDVYGEDLGYVSPSFRSRALSIKPISRVTMPLFGMVHDVGNTGFYVISESGANYSQIKFKSTGLINDYYTTYFSYRYRESYEQYQSRSNEDQYRIAFQDDPNEYELVQRYVFLSGNQADYVGMAKSYQDYLLDNGLLGEERRTDYNETPTKVDFIGSEITMGILSSKSQTITTYNEVTEILATMQEDGYQNLITSLKTFDMRDDSYRFDVIRSLGGSKDFEKMIDFFDENNIEFSYFSDYVRNYESYSKAHAQTLSKREIYYIELSWMFYAHYVTSTRYYEQFAKDDYEDLSEYGIEGISLAGFDKAIFTNYKDGVVYSNKNMDEIALALSYFEEKDIMTNIYLPDAYLYKYVNEYYDTPISSSDFSFTMASIPFLQLVIGGYVDMYSPYLNFISDESTSLLRLVEYGVYPSYVLTGGSTYDLKSTNSSNVYISEYDVLSRRIGNYFRFINEGLTSTIGSEMIDHTFIASGVVLVEYDNGVKIVLNYNDFAITVGDYILPAEGYEVIS